MEPSPLGRDHGVIASIMKDRGWGFVRCATIDSDLYFRIDEGARLYL